MTMLQRIANKIVNDEKRERKKERHVKAEETHFRVAGGGGSGSGSGGSACGRGGSALRFLAPGLPVLGDRHLTNLAYVIHD